MRAKKKRRHGVSGWLETEWLEGDVVLSRDPCPVQRRHVPFGQESKPLGLLDQKIFARRLRPENQRKSVGSSHVQDVLPVKEKESYRWIEALGQARSYLPGRRL